MAHAQYRIPDEQRLIRKLMRRYDPSARPVFNASEKVVVEFGLTLIQIIDMVRLFLIISSYSFKYDNFITLNGSAKCA